MASSRNAKRIRPAGLDAVVTTLDLSSLGEIFSLAVDSDGTRLVCTASALYVVSPSGRQSLLAGHKTETGFKDGQGMDARFYQPCGIVVDGEGNVLVADTQNHVLRKVARSGAVSTLAGSGEAGYADGIGAAAQFYEPWGVVVDAEGAIFVADSSNNCVRQVAPGDGVVSTLAGDAEAGPGFADGLGAAANFNSPCGLALDTDGHLIVADSENNCIRKVTTVEGRVTTVAGSAEADAGFADGEATAARFDLPVDIAVDGNNNILVSDQDNHRIRIIASTGGRVATVAGSAEEGTFDGTGPSVRLSHPNALVLDERGHLLVLVGAKGSVRVIKASLAPPHHLSIQFQPAVQDSLRIDYSKLIGDTTMADVTFAVDGQRFPAHRCVLAARSPFFRAMFETGKGMHEEGSRAAGKDIVVKDVSAGAFRMLLSFLYAHTLPEEEDCGEGLEVGEMARVADRFQASELYAHCVEQFKEGLAVGNVVVRLVQAHESGLAGLEEAAMEYLNANVLALQVRCIHVKLNTFALVLCQCVYKCGVSLVRVFMPMLTVSVLGSGRAWRR